MARMYSRNKGKAGSKKPFKSKAHWLNYKPKEVEMLVAKFAKAGKTGSQIGLIMRDTYGIPDVRKILGKKIAKLLEEKKLKSKLPEDLTALIKRSIALRKHIEANHKDESARRGLILTESKIGRLIKYYKNTKVLPENWKFDRTKAEFFVE
ncbi:30S ribosomal protein S15 [Candidatus Woesearchaeota archaeon]|nr:30S ribosomal protein S15 [Candidatus Woesearchaeota archaeon]